MEKTLQEQIKRVQTLTDNQKERFLRIYFHGCQHLFVDSAVRTADPE
jgi:cyclopropane fatty-acyl-phospholipid synthase-like methyltransferase